MKLKKHSLLIFAVIFLLIGMLYYLLFRDSIFASQWLGVEKYHQHLSFISIDWFPSFVHQFSFSILTWIALGRRYKTFSILLWLSVNIAFEMAQALPEKYYIVLPKTIMDYCKNGTFAYDDIIALVLASLLAYIVMTRPKT